MQKQFDNMQPNLGVVSLIVNMSIDNLSCHLQVCSTALKVRILPVNTRHMIHNRETDRQTDRQTETETETETERQRQTDCDRDRER